MFIKKTDDMNYVRLKLFKVSFISFYRCFLFVLYTFPFLLKAISRVVSIRFHVLKIIQIKSYLLKKDLYQIKNYKTRIIKSFARSLWCMTHQPNEYCFNANSFLISCASFYLNKNVFNTLIQNKTIKFS